MQGQNVDTGGEGGAASGMESGAEGGMESGTQSDTSRGDAPASIYTAFISYRHAVEDRRFAKWLHSALESYRTPRRLVQQGARPRVAKVFRDEEELAASADLSAEIDAALQASDFLVVVCSPRTPGSKWINQEIRRFRALGRGHRILACLIEGEPAESFPPALLCTLEDGTAEPLAADFRKVGDVSEAAARRLARLKLLSTLLGCRFDDLVLREQARRRQLQLIGTSVLVAVLAVISGLALLAVQQRDEAQAQRAVAVERRDATLLTQSRFLASLSEQATEAGDASLGSLLALEALPRQWHAPDRPYHPPAMAALYRAVLAQRELLTLGGGGLDAAGSPTPEVQATALAGDGQTLLVGTTAGAVQAWDIATRRRLHTVQVGKAAIQQLAIGSHDRQLLAAVGTELFEVDLAQGSARKILTADAPIESLTAHQAGAALVVVTAQGDTAQARLWTRGSDGYRAHPQVALPRQLLYHATPSADGLRLAAGDAQTPYVQIADLQAGVVTRLGEAQFTADRGTVSAHFSPTGAQLIASSSRGTWLFDLSEAAAPIPLIGHYDTVLRAAISPDGSHVATGSEDGRVLLWSREDNFARPQRSFDGFQRGANLALVQGSEAERVLQQARRLHDDFEAAVGHLVFSADGQRLLASSGDRSVSVFDVQAGKRMLRLSGHAGRIDAVAISADGARISTLDRARTARVWRSSAVPSTLLYGDGGAVTAAVLPAGALPPLALVQHAELGCGGLWRAWQFLSNTPLGPVRRPADVASTPSGIGTLSLDGSILLTGFPESGQLQQVALRTGQVLPLALPAGADALDCAYAQGQSGEAVLVRADGQERRLPLAQPPAASAAPAPARPPFPHAGLANPGSRRWLLSNQGKLSPAEVAAQYDPAGFSTNHDGTRLLVLRRDKHLALLDAQTGREIRRFVPPPPAAASKPVQADGEDLAFSDDGRFITGRTPGGARIWKAGDGQLLRELASASGAPSLVLLGGMQRKHLVVVEADGRLLLHDPDGKRAPTVLAQTFQDKLVLRVSPDGRRLAIEPDGRACGEHKPSLWDIDNNRQLATLPQSSGCAWGLQFSADGRTLLGTVSEPQGIAVWEAEGGAELVRQRGCLPAGVEMFDADPSDVMASGFSDDGRHVFAGTLAGALCIWPHPGAADALIAHARAQVSRGFSPAERARLPIQAVAPAAPSAAASAR